jgi:hypothetical protein
VCLHILFEQNCNGADSQKPILGIVAFITFYRFVSLVEVARSNQVNPDNLGSHAFDRKLSIKTFCLWDGGV